MKRTILIGGAVLSLFTLWTPAQAGHGHGCGPGCGSGWSIGIGVGAPYYRPYYPYYPYPYYYRPYYPVVVAPPPVIVQQPPIIQQVPAPASPPVYQAPAPTPLPAPTATRAVSASEPAGVDQCLQMLSNNSESVRADNVMQLGRMKATRAIDPLAATLSGDQSPVVREAAARALGLIGSPAALTALQHAAQADSDHDVRRSAQFAVEVIQSRH